MLPGQPMKMLPLLVMVPKLETKPKTVMVPLLAMVPKLVIVPELETVTLGGMPTVIPFGIVTVSPKLIVIGGAEPPHVAGSSQFPLCVAVKLRGDRLLIVFRSVGSL